MQNFNVLVTGQHLVADAQTILQDAGARLQFMAEPIDEQALIDCLTDNHFDAMVVRGPKPITARVMAAAPHLKIIAKNGAGVDSIDLQEAARRDICVAVAPGANAYAVAEHTFAMMLALVRDLGGHDRRIRKGGWEGSAYQGRDFAGSVVGIIGFGSIGRRVAKMADALGAHVLVLGPAEKSDQFQTESSLDTFLSKVDILSLHCPLTDQTRGLIGAREIALMKPGSFIVNTARGGLIDEPALAAALSAGHLAGAALDTLAVEPMDPNSPLLNVDNVIVTPHIAGVTRQAALAVATITARNVVDCVQGRALPIHHVVRVAEVGA